MTIVQSPRGGKNKKLITVSLVVSGVLLVFALLLTLFSYNQIVNLNHELSSRRDILQEVQARNAELKQSVYNLVSYENLERVARERSLVKEKNPEYLKGRSMDLTLR